MLSRQQKKAAQAVVNVFETGRPLGDYGNVTFHPRDPGQLTYGRSQTTLASGNLYLLLKDYCSRSESAYGSDLAAYLDRAAERDASLNYDERFKALLRQAGEDPVMQETQDRFFDRVYWDPSLRAAERLGISTALGICVVYDSRIHGSWGRMRDRTLARYGPVSETGERRWIESYVRVRKDWLAQHSNPLLRKTVYRMESFEVLMAEDNWDLRLPFMVRGVRIDEAVLAGRPFRFSAEDPKGDERVLRWTVPAMRGEDVRKVQQALVEAGYPLEVDGIYGPRTAQAVARFQRESGVLKVDGIVGPATRAFLFPDD